MTDFTALYSKANLTAWGLIGFGSNSEAGANDPPPPDGCFREPFLNWAALPKRTSAGDPQPMWFLCCDVLRLDKSLTLTQGAFVFARRIEIAGGGALTLDHTEGNRFAVEIHAQEIVDLASGKAVPLGITSIGDNESIKTASFSPESKRGSGGIHWEQHDQAPIIFPNSEKIDPAWLMETEPLRLFLVTLFQIATLLSTENAGLAVNQLRWVSDLANASAETHDLAKQADSFAMTLVAQQSTEANAVLVPQLDLELYAQSADGAMQVLRDRQRLYDAYTLQLRQDLQWQDAARAAMDTQQNQLELDAKLEKQADETCEQLEHARQLAVGQMVQSQALVTQRRFEFEDGVEKWARDKRTEAILDMVAGVGQILAQIPSMVIAGPEVALMPTLESMSSALQAGVAAGTAIMSGVAVSLKSGIGGGVKAAKPKGARIPDPNDDNDDVLDNDTNSIRSSSDLGSMSEYDNAYDSDSAGYAPISAPSESAEDYLAAFNTAQSLGSADTAEFETALDHSPAKSPSKTVLEKSQKAGKEIAEGLKKAGEGAKDVVKAALRIVAIARAADSMRQTSGKILDSASETATTSFSSIEVTGLDVVTGGAQDWSSLTVAIDGLFEKISDLKDIEGGTTYRDELKNFIILGKTLCEAKLALSKARSQLAEARMRRLADVNAVAIAERRIKFTGQAVAHDHTVSQLIFSRLLETKRAIYLALESYRRAFRYFTLASDEETPTLPKLIDKTDQFALAVSRIVGKQLQSDALIGVSGRTPQSMKTTLVLNDPKTLESLRSKGTATWTIPLDCPVFHNFGRVRFNLVRIFPEGLTTTGMVEIQIATSGLYSDKIPGGKRGSVVNTARFASASMRRNFVYSGKDPTDIEFDGDIAPRYTHDFFNPTPFTAWTIVIGHQDGSALDLSGIKSLRLEFQGEATPL